MSKNAKLEGYDQILSSQNFSGELCIFLMVFNWLLGRIVAQGQLIIYFNGKDFYVDFGVNR